MNPWPLRCDRSALPTELHPRAGRLPNISGAQCLLVRLTANHRDRRSRASVSQRQVMHFSRRRCAAPAHCESSKPRRGCKQYPAGGDCPQRSGGDGARKGHRGAQHQQRADVASACRCLGRRGRHRRRRARPVTLSLAGASLRMLPRNLRGSRRGSAERVELLAELNYGRCRPSVRSEQARYVGCQHHDPNRSQQHQHQFCHASPASPAGLPPQGVTSRRANSASPLDDGSKISGLPPRRRRRGGRCPTCRPSSPTGSDRR